MRALLDINVLIALLDPDHVQHEGAHEWWAIESKQGWASCPLTENGVARIMSNSAYSQKKSFSPGEILEQFSVFVTNTDHEFWPDELSLRDDRVFDSKFILASGQITDIYLLALAAKRKGRLVTFDAGIRPSAVKGAAAGSLVRIS